MGVRSNNFFLYPGKLCKSSFDRAQGMNIQKPRSVNGKKFLIQCSHFLTALFFLTLPLTIVACATASENTITVTGQLSLANGLQTFIADSSFFDRHRTELLTTDPFDPDKKKHNYSGIPIETLVRAAGANPEHSITLIASDQYTCRMEKSMIINSGGIIADRMDGKPITEFQGGPLMIMFPDEAGVHPGMYVWQLAFLVAGDNVNPEIKVSMGSTVKVLNAKKMSPLLKESDTFKLFVPMGINKKKSSHGKPTGFVLSDILKTGIENIKTISFIPMTGKTVSFDMNKMDPSKIFIACKLNGSLIPASHGGPWVAVFAPEAFKQQKDRMPSVPALFFLQQIKIEPY